MSAAQLIGKPNETRQGAGRLDDCKAAVAPEPVLALDDHGEIQALVEDFGERPGGIQRQWAQHRLDFAEKIARQPGRLSLGPAVRRHEDDAVFREFRHEHIVEQLILLIDQPHRASADGLQLVGDAESIRTALQCAGLQKLLEARHPDLKEFVEIRAGNAQESYSLQERNPAVLGLLQHPLIEVEKRQFPVDVELRCVQINIVH